jgi:autotransporter passenger strand-loop-strand repeat protein
VVAYSGITVTSGETLQLAAGDTATNVTIASGGTLVASNGSTAAGTIIDAGGTMNFGSGASLGTIFNANVTFAGGGTLRIINWLTYFNFFPTINGLGAGDIIDLAGFADPRSVPTSAFIDFTGHDLDFRQNNQTFELLLDPHRNYSGYHFFTLPDGTGGTEILVGPFRTIAVSTLAPDRH